MSGRDGRAGYSVRVERKSLSAVAVSDTGRVRGHNEDVASISEVELGGVRYMVWLVADGMGGGIRGDEASAIARDEMLAALANEAGADPVTVLRQGVERANAAVYELGSEGGTLGFSRMGTTLVAALVEPGTGRHWILNVGDSRAYLLRAGTATQLTTDHSLVAEAAAAGLITAEEARTSNRKNVITRAIGIEPVVDPEILGPLDLAEDDLLLLCTDGLHGMIEDAAIGGHGSEGSLGAAAARLIQSANAAGGRDNITVLLGGWRDAEAAAEPSASHTRPALEPNPDDPSFQAKGRSRVRVALWVAGGLALVIAAAAGVALVVL